MPDTMMIEKVKHMVAEIGELDNVETISPDAHLIEDLGMDSMLLLEVLSSLEQTYKISIPETEFPNMTTVAKCADVVSRYQQAAA